MVATRFVVDQTGPASLALLRYAIGVLVLLPAVLVAARDVAPIALLGIVQFGILIALLNYGLRFVPSARAALIFATLPLLTMVVAAALGQERLTLAKLSDFPGFAGFFFGEIEPDPAELDGGRPMLAAAEEALHAVEPFDAASIETALRAKADELGLKPRQAFQPIRVAVTGSRVSPGLFESIELLGRDVTLKRLRAAAAGDAASG